MEWIIILIIVGVVLGPIISVLFWVFAIKTAVNHVDAFEKDQKSLMNLINRYTQASHNGQYPTKINRQVISKLMNMRNHMNQMDHFRRQQHETKMSGMINQVTSAGFTNFDPNSFY